MCPSPKPGTALLARLQPRQAPPWGPHSVRQQPEPAEVCPHVQSGHQSDNHKVGSQVPLDGGEAGGGAGEQKRRQVAAFLGWGWGCGATTHCVLRSADLDGDCCLGARQSQAAGPWGLPPSVQPVRARHPPIGQPQQQGDDGDDVGRGPKLCAAEESGEKHDPRAGANQKHGLAGGEPVLRVSGFVQGVIAWVSVRAYNMQQQAAP